MSDWSKAIEFFNSHLRFTREQYFNYMNSKTKGLCTLDTYRNNLTSAGFLVTVDRGMYKRIKKIPVNLSVKGCLKIIKDNQIKQNNYNLIIKEEKIKNMTDNAFVISKRLEAINA